jgi:hypothetical protein
MIAHLTFIPARRSSIKYPNGTYKSERQFLDFVVDGQSLWEVVGKPRDLVSVLCAEYSPAESVRAVNRLRLTEKADFPGDRRSLFICSACGDLGCGAITALVVRQGDTIVWKDFGFENNYEENINLADYKGVGPFGFDFATCEIGFLQAIEALNALRISAQPR